MKRGRRYTTLAEKVKKVLLKRASTIRQIRKQVGYRYMETSVSAAIRRLRTAKYGGYRIEKELIISTDHTKTYKYKIKGRRVKRKRKV